MAKSEIPEPTRSKSEIAFVLRNAKHRRGAQVLRDMSRPQDDDKPAPKKRAAGKAKPRAKRR